jgi:hypothetical protein
MKKRMLILSLVVVAFMMLMPNKVMAAETVIDETCYVDGDITYVFSGINAPNHKAYRNRSGKWAFFTFDDIKNGHAAKSTKKSIRLIDGAVLKNIRVANQKDGNKRVTFTFKKFSTSKELASYKGFQIKVYSDIDAEHCILTKNVRSSSSKVIFKGVEKGKTYYVKVRGYNLDDNGKRMYSNYTNMKSFVVE